MTCCCQTIGAPKEIRFCSEHHAYWLGDRRLESVSGVIRAVYPRKSWDGVDEAVIAHARERGKRVDRYLSAYALTGNVTTEPGEWEEVLDRLDRCVKWWDKNVNGEIVQVQKILYSEAYGIAGTVDFVIGDMVLDLKNTAKLEKSYAIQLGAYAAMEQAKGAACLHVTKTGCKLIPYDMSEIVTLWGCVCEWYQCIRRLESA